MIVAQGGACSGGPGRGARSAAPALCRCLRLPRTRRRRCPRDWWLAGGIIDFLCVAELLLRGNDSLWHLFAHPG